MKELTSFSTRIGLLTFNISAIKVRAGDDVKQGDVLVELDSRELKARADQAHQAVNVAKARLAKAERDFNRIQQLFKTDAVSHMGQLDFVIVKTEQGPIRRYVRLGVSDQQDRVEVISGLAPGEAILTTAR